MESPPGLSYHARFNVVTMMDHGAVQVYTQIAALHGEDAGRASRNLPVYGMDYTEADVLVLPDYRFLHQYGDEYLGYDVFEPHEDPASSEVPFLITGDVYTLSEPLYAVRIQGDSPSLYELRRLDSHEIIVRTPSCELTIGRMEIM